MDKYQPVACAIVDEAGNIINMVMADPAVDVAPKGYVLAARPEGSTVDVEWTVDLESQKFWPSPEMIEQAALDGAALDPIDAVLVKSEDLATDEKP